jgi:hypothetical protein
MSCRKSKVLTLDVFCAVVLGIVAGAILISPEFYNFLDFFTLGFLCLSFLSKKSLSNHDKYANVHRAVAHRYIQKYRSDKSVDRQRLSFNYPCRFVKKINL